MHCNEARALGRHTEIVRGTECRGLTVRDERAVRDHGSAQVAGRPRGWTETKAGSQRSREPHALALRLRNRIIGNDSEPAAVIYVIRRNPTWLHVEKQQLVHLL